MILLSVNLVSCIMKYTYIVPKTPYIMEQDGIKLSIHHAYNFNIFSTFLKLKVSVKNNNDKEIVFDVSSVLVNGKSSLITDYYKFRPREKIKLEGIFATKRFQDELYYVELAPKQVVTGWMTFRNPLTPENQSDYVKGQNRLKIELSWGTESIKLISEDPDNLIDNALRKHRELTEKE